METTVWIRERIQQRQRSTQQTVWLCNEKFDTEVTSRTYGVQRSKRRMSSFISLINRYDYQRSSKRSAYSLSKS